VDREDVRPDDPGMRKTVVVVDDHPGFRELARAFLAAAGYEVLADVPDGRSALDAVDRLRPEVVVLDVRLPDIDGFEIARRLASRPDAPAVVLVSSREEADYGAAVARSGARAFITKSKLSRAALEAALAS
jgi:DNA-binding NarL/FixJ family response regulator